MLLIRTLLIAGNAKISGREQLANFRHRRDGSRQIVEAKPRHAGRSDCARRPRSRRFGRTC